MRQKLLLRILVVFLIIPFAAQSALAAGIIFRIPFNGLTAANGSRIDPDYDGPGNIDSANVEFFTSRQTNPTSTANRVADFSHLRLSTQHEIGTTSVDGGNVYIRSWDGTPRTRGSHYGLSAGYEAASGIAPARNHTVADFRTDYLADAPVNAPTITSVSEANERIGDTTQVVLSLTINYTYNQGSAPNIILATGYDVKYWLDTEAEPSDSDPNRVVSASGTSWSLPAADPVTGDPFGAGTYTFRVRARNWYGAGPWSSLLAWTTLSGGPGGPTTVTYSFRRPEGDLGLNPISFPFATVSGVGNLRELVMEINTQVGGNIVTTAGWWDSEAQQPRGYIITYGSETVNDGINFVVAGGAPEDPASVSLGRDFTYQIGVNQQALDAVRLEGTR